VSETTIAVALEGQLRLDDQPAFHEAAALARQHGERLIVLVCRREGQRLRGPHQQRLEREAMASLQANLAAVAIPLLQFPQSTTAEALETIRGLVVPAVVLQGQESRLFADWPIPAETFPRVFAEFRRGLQQAPQPPLPPADLTGLGAGLEAWPQALAAAAAANPSVRAQRMRSTQRLPLLRR